MGYNSPCVSPLLQEVYLRAGVENKRAVMAMMLPRPGGVLLDVGCADGSDALALASKVQATTIVGLELADHFVEQARGRGIEVHQADISERWPLADGSVDALHSNQVIEHLSQTDHFMREIRRVLKPGGYAVVSTNNLASWHNIVALLVGLQPLPCHVSDEAVVGNPLALEETRYGPQIHRHLRIFTGRALADLARAHGLELERSIASGYYPLSGHAARLMARLDRTHGVYLVQRYRVASADATAAT